MKKLLAGCLFGLVLMGVVAGATVYMLWRAAAPVVDSVSRMTEGVKKLGGVAEIERGLTTTTPFTAPDSGELTPAQVERFIRVQTHVRDTLGARADALQAKYRELSRPDPEGPLQVPSIARLVGALSELSDVYLDARRAQVQAMNAEGFSRDELSWVRLRVYQAAGLDVVRYDARELEDLIKDVATGVRAPVPTVELPDAPARNRELVKPHVDQLTAWLGMAAFGL